MAARETECGFFGKRNAIQAGDTGLEQEGVAFGEIDILGKHDAQSHFIVYPEGVYAILRLRRAAGIAYCNVVIRDVLRLLTVKEVAVVAFVANA